MPKRAFDLVVASVLLGLNLPVLLLAALLIKLESPGPVFHRARRVGKDGKLFTLYKLRTMLVDAPSRGPGITRRGDPRVTRLGRVLRYSKIDEFPQLLNVLRGEMSLVGPRPEDPRFVAHYTPEQRRVLSVRPGIASPAAVKYFEEEALLAGAGQDVEAFYLSRVLPDKLRLDLEYLERQSLWLDAGVLAGALAALLSPKGEARPAPRPLAARAPHRAERPSLRRAVQRYAPRVLVDAAIVLASLLLAWMARSVTAHLDLGPALAFSLVAAAAYCGANGLFLLYQRMWRYASAGEVVFIYSAVAAATALLAGVVFLWPGERPVPVSVVPLMGSFAFAGFVGVRYRRRLWAAVRWRWRALRGGRAAPHTRVLAVGAREAGGMVAWRFLNEREGERYELVGFADDDPAVQGMRLHGVPVLGDWRAIPSLVARHRVDLLVVALDGLSGREVRQLLDLCGQTPAAIKVLPSFFEQMRANRHVPALRRMVPEDLLGRSSVEIDRQACRGLLAGKTVLVTGGAGSIGSELCRQIATFAPRQLLILDNNESGLHDLVTGFRISDFELRIGDGESRISNCELRIADLGSGTLDPGRDGPQLAVEPPQAPQNSQSATPNSQSAIRNSQSAIRNPQSAIPIPLIADVTNQARMQAIFEAYRPQVVFHTAAYKHVPLMEDHPDEAVRVNLLGTCLVANLAARYGAEVFVFVSTDKAVNPSSVMGATKRLGEAWIVTEGMRIADFGLRISDPGRDGPHPASQPAQEPPNPQSAIRNPQFTAVRFGNVLGSRGSVVPTFERQIEHGGPVTVTHPEMTRYFMSVAEAASLIIQAGALTRGGDVFMLEMGQQLRIDELARRLIRLRGLRPEVDIPIVYVGCRPGEKLHEELLAEGEERCPTAHPRIFRVRANAVLDPDALQRQVEDLLALRATGRKEELAARLLAYAATPGEAVALAVARHGDHNGAVSP